MLANESQHRGRLSVLFLVCLFSGLTLVSGLFHPRVAVAFEDFWVQNHTETPLWSGPDSRAVSFGLAPQWSYFRVVAPQRGARLQVVDARNGGSALSRSRRPWGRAAHLLFWPPRPLSPPAAVGPYWAVRRSRCGRCPAFRRASPPSWVANFEETVMWAGPEKGAPSLGPVPQFRRFLVMEPQDGIRLRVWNPEKELLRLPGRRGSGSQRPLGVGGSP